MAAVSMMAYPVRDSFSSYPQQYSMYQSRAHLPPNQGPSVSTNPYASFASTSQQQPYQQSLSRSHSSGSSASEDGSRPSLPSISNLLGIADGERPGQEDASQQTQEDQKQQARLAHAQRQEQQQQQQAAFLEQRQRSTYPSHDLSNSQRTIIAPPQPLRNDSVVEHTHTPSTISTGSSLSGQPYYMGSSLNNTEADQQRVAQINYMKRQQSFSSQPNTSPFGTSPYTTSPYGSSPGALSNGSYYSPTDPYQSSLYSQRPLPSNFPPPPPMPVQSTPGLPTGNPWEHHHYISPSSQASFPQSQDRYICQTCNKAFSRPSSLKIHSHSHTGEKPFKCPHAGCGKAFSVRSNMKRHERGCHTGPGGTVSSVNPSHFD